MRSKNGFIYGRCGSILTSRWLKRIYFYKEILFTPIIHLQRRIIDVEKISLKKNILLQRATGKPMGSIPGAIL